MKAEKYRKEKKNAKRTGSWKVFLKVAGAVRRQNRKEKKNAK